MGPAQRRAAAVPGCAGAALRTSERLTERAIGLDAQAGVLTDAATTLLTLAGEAAGKAARLRTRAEREAGTEASSAEDAAILRARSAAAPD